MGGGMIAHLTIPLRGTALPQRNWSQNSVRTAGFLGKLERQEMRADLEPISTLAQIR